MRYLRFGLLAVCLALSACKGGVASAPNKSDCSFFNNCKCQDWYGTCSGHG